VYKSRESFAGVSNTIFFFFLIERVIVLSILVIA
jgi:hypothetical protein